MNFLRILCSLFLSFGLLAKANAQENPQIPEGYLLSVETSEGETTQEIAVGSGPTKRDDSNDIAHFYTGFTVNMPVIIVLPFFPLLDVTQSLGIQTKGGLLQAEVYAGLNPSNALNGRKDSRLVIPYGGRVRIAPIKVKEGRLFVEYDKSANFYNHQNWGGQLTDIHKYQVGFQSPDGRVQVSVGMQTDVHQPWDYEDHAPEPGKGGTLSVTYRWNVLKKSKKK